MNGLNMARARKLLQQYDFENLFIEELGWDRYREELFIEVDDFIFPLTAVAEKRGLVVFICQALPETGFPLYARRRKIEKKVAKVRHEHLIVYIDQEKTRQVWQWVKREPGRPDACREHTFYQGQSGDALLQKIDKLVVTLDEEESISIVDMAGRTRAAFNVEKITKKFYERFKKEHSAFLEFVTGITEMGDQQWYASLMLNRLMFVYFIQKKGFLDNDPDYLRNRLHMMQREQGKGRFHSFYRHFLLRLFHDGLGKKTTEPNPELDRLLGRVPYLNGGLFDVHELEEEYRNIQISDEAFEQLFDFFEQYQWHLDERPLRQDNEINPDVLGYIFEKYINQKQMGAYYTKEDITEYISKNSVIPYLFDAAQKKCKIAFEGEQSIWKLLQNEPDRYIYEAVKKGCELPLPPEIEEGVDTTKPGLLERRKEWNKPAPEEYALPTEIWREVVARRQRYAEVRAKLAAGEVTSINDLITYNLNLRQFAQDVIENCEGPGLLRAFWHAIVGRIPRRSGEKPENGITILDPTCGSGAFLFAALNILEPLYEACLDRMQSFVTELEQSPDKTNPEKFSDFKAELTRVGAHPNQSYFVMKSIILNNLYGVDIMAEAVEICKLRLFLKLVAQVEKSDQIEPLPDIDFNIRCGNTLVGFATYDEVKEAMTTSQGETLIPYMYEDRMAKIEQKAQDLQQAFDIFRRRQVEGDGSVPHEDKFRVRERLNTLEDELNRALAEKYSIIAEEDEKAYTKWLVSHQPFHWFIEYYGIMNNGGFDVIIGNPPYVEYSKVQSEYRIKGYKTINCGNLYAFILEKLLILKRTTGLCGMIVPMSGHSTDRMEPLIKEFYYKSGSLHIMNISGDAHPSVIFPGVKFRLAIFIFNDIPYSQGLYSTKYTRWYAGAREHLFYCINYVEVVSKVPGRIPKISSTYHKSILDKIFLKKSSIGIYSGEYSTYYHNVPVFWIRAHFFMPYFCSERDGEKASTQLKQLFFFTEEQTAVASGLLCSSVFYIWWITTSDCYHLNKKEIDGFPVNLEDTILVPYS